MASDLDYPPQQVESAITDRLVEVAKDWSLAHGLCVRPPPTVIPAQAHPGNILATPVPVTLFPSPFPESCFKQGLAVQRAYNELYASISQDEEFLTEMVKQIGNSDDFIQKLWDVHLRVKAEGYVQSISLGLFRSDYMVHQGSAASSPGIKQVEFNTIASSFGGLSSQTTALHKFLNKQEYGYLGRSSTSSSLNLPENTCTRGLAAGIREAFKVYGPSKSSNAIPKCVIFLTQGGERNIFDQRHLEYELQAQASDDRMPIFRLPFSEIGDRTSLTEGDKRVLQYRPPHRESDTYEVAVVYMRSGYGPDDYSGDSAWNDRYQIERSAAIKCPSVLTQIAGTKKVQQVLATPASADSEPPTLHRFLKPDAASNTKAVADIERTFTNIYPMDTSAAGQVARKIALDPQQCQSYVLKPQREGGGNNIYRSTIPEHLKKIPEKNWDAYILMEIITPPPVYNMILRNGKLEKGNVICELGVYGTCIWDQNKATAGGANAILWNESEGYLLRTKGDKSEEGGVAAGFGCMDSCALVKDI
ncbi:uncharacterized protein BCR38DRAFT_360901 [Pseudomassariella vexata]|uniref:Glutathione synthetase n=1 Tax=Pseudomassariella vexata TaxID=1141098 RepID=A0A1Y2EG24_9PEZI|nr:uncharacterized protein BCR38DRAFT_360901 [Pseudomassariella vexata]ORY69745.1 hypothetical protein BCR38DRAFT_360901 [Pseudomassariella vexata]